MVYFSIEGFVKAIIKDFRKTLIIMFIPFVSLSIAIFHASFDSESFRNQFVVFHLLHSASFNVSSYRLMVSNMTKSDIRIFGLEHLIQAAPIIVLFLGK